MSEIRTRLLEGHYDGCFAIEAVEEGRWPTPWAFLDRIQKRDAIGRYSRPGASGDRWWYVRCNDPSCHGAMTVNERDILVALETS